MSSDIKFHFKSLRTVFTIVSGDDVEPLDVVSKGAILSKRPGTIGAQKFFALIVCPV
jgi:hypothetical protein